MKKYNIILLVGVIMIGSCKPKSNKNQPNQNNKKLTDFKKYSNHGQYGQFNYIDSAINHPDSVFYLYTNVYTYKTLDTIRKFKNLKHLYIYHTNTKNLLQRIALKLSNLSDLITIHLGSDCHITQIPKEIVLLKGLKELDIEDTIKYINNAFYELKNLQTLHLSIEKPVSEKFVKLQSLQHLYLDVIGKDTLPIIITKLQNLRSLTLPEEISYLPKQIANLQNLRLLDITMCDSLVQEEINYYKKYNKFNELNIVKKKMSNCKIMQGMGNYW